MALSEEPSCGDRGCKCSLAWRGICCFIVMVGSIMLAYSVSDSRHAINECWMKSNCIFFGDVSQHTTACRDEEMRALPSGGPKQLCDFSLLSAVVQLVVSFILAVTVVVKTWCTRRANNSTAFSVLELVVSCMCCLCAVITGTIISAGTAAFSQKVFDHWDESYPAEEFPEMKVPRSIGQVYLLNDLNSTTGEPLYYHTTIIVGMIGTWLAALAWTIYIVVAAISCHRWQRPMSAEDKPVGKFTKFSNTANSEEDQD